MAFASFLAMLLISRVLHLAFQSHLRYPVPNTGLLKCNNYHYWPTPLLRPSSKLSRASSHLVLAQQHQVVGHHVAYVQVDDPVHEVEAHEADWKHYPGVLVNVRGSDAQQFVDILWREREREIQS